MRQRIGKYRTTRPFRCERCHQLGLHSTVAVGAGVIERRPRDGRRRDHAEASCSHGHQWWSVHPEAIRRARLANTFVALSVPITQECTSP